MAPEVREAQQRARKLAETMAKAPAGWQPAMQGNAYLPNGELNPLVKAAQEAAMKLAMQVGKLTSFARFQAFAAAAASSYLCKSQIASSCLLGIQIAMFARACAIVHPKGAGL